MKLKLKGYILRRCDTNEYLAELVLNDKSAISGWTSLKNKASLSKCKTDAMATGGFISEGIGVSFKLYELYKFQDCYLATCICQYTPELLKN